MCGDGGQGVGSRGVMKISMDGGKAHRGMDA
jgi:hypothetical protein